MTDLKDLIPFLRANNVSIFKQGSLQIVFHQEQPTGETKDQIDNLRKEMEKSLPPDLKGDDLFNHDKMMFWSSPPDHDQLEMPLTGENQVI